MTMLETRAALTPGPGPLPDPKRFKALVVIAIAQLMLVLDASVVTIALPSAQRALHISVADRQWVMTAYTLAFGGLLLIGGRVADYLGRKRAFVLGLLAFAAASALGGLAQGPGMLFAARALQGSFAALMAPASLSLLQVTFSDPQERSRAFGVYGAVAGSGAAIGLVLGGLLTQFASWRWTLLINAPIAVLAALAASRVVRESRAEGDRHYDVPGAIVVTAGLLAMVYGFTRAETNGWGAAATVGLLAGGAGLVGAFALMERRVAHPLLPLRVVADRNRGGSFLASLLVGVGLFGTFLFLTYYLQGILHYSPLRSGVAFLPFSGGIVVSATAASRALPRLGPRLLLAGGLLVAVGGLGWFTQIGVGTSYATHVLPAEVVLSLGLGFVFVAFSSTALVGVEPHDAGVASALVNATQQVGGSLGTALLNTVAASATASYIAARHLVAQGYVHGYDVGFVVSAAVLALALAASAAMVKASRSEVATVAP